MPETCVVVGASHAAAQFVVSLRQGGWEGEIVLIGDETDLPYHRPPLSKDFLSGTKELDEILIRPASVYETANITLKLGTRVTAIDRDKKTVSTDKDETLSYDKLVLATGARVRRLPIDGETAASMRKSGMEVTVLEAMDRILQRVTAPVMSDFYRRVHTEEGVVIAENEMAASIAATDKSLVVHTKSENEYPTDIVIIGIGVIPNTQLADEAGLDVGNGIIVNEFCQTTDPDIYAIGDVTWHHNPIYDTHLRLESVPNATEQGKTAALHINGKEKPYNSLPWFWSDQFDLTREFMMARMALTKGQSLDKAILVDVDADLKSAIQ